MYRTAEWVSPMHPDKMCDRISDSILDACLAVDARSRVAIETMGGHGIVHVIGEMTTSAFVDVPHLVRGVVGKDIGVDVNIVQQSPEIARGVDTGGAGDQGIMVGYACGENDELIPQELFLARSLGQALYAVHPFDGKTQVTLDNGTVRSIVASWQNVRAGELEEIIEHWGKEKDIDLAHTTLHCNPAGDWHVGGFDADTGLTGRKIVVDNYGPRIPTGGGCFSGKDATKVDRSGAYKARQLAVRLLREHKAHEVQTTLAYAIGEADPLQVQVLIDGRAHAYDGDLSEFTPTAIIQDLQLTKPQFARLAERGHFGTGNVWDG